MMEVGFEALASKYDEIFSHSSTGKLQRQVVWHYLHQSLERLDDKHILDMGCGTGEDIQHFLTRGVGGLEAFDPSANMVESARKKLSHTNAHHQTNLWVDSVQSWLQKKPDVHRFDLIFSNFGALNLLSPTDFQFLAQYLSKHLSKGAQLVLVLMPTFCLSESVYFLLKGKWLSAFRRRHSPLQITIEGTNLCTWYYKPKEVRSIFSDFQLVACRPIGLIIPPSYLAPAFDKRPRSLASLTKLDVLLRRMPGAASISDHFLIHLKK